MGKTSTASKREWNALHYEQVILNVQKGDRAKLKNRAAEVGCSVNRLITDCINARYPGLLAALDDESKKKKLRNSET